MSSVHINVQFLFEVFLVLFITILIVCGLYNF